MPTTASNSDKQQEGGNRRPHSSSMLTAILLRYNLSFVGNFLAMAFVIFLTIRGRVGAWYIDPSRWATTLGIALTFAHLAAFTVILSHEIPSRLPVPRAVQGTIATLAGVVSAALTWMSYHMIFLANTSPDWRMIASGAIGLSSGFVLATLWRDDRSNLRVIALIAITTVTIALPILIGYARYSAAFGTDPLPQALLYFDTARQFWITVPVFAATIATFGHLPTYWLHHD